MEGVGGALAKDWTFSGDLHRAVRPAVQRLRRHATSTCDGNARNDIAPGTTRNQFRLPNRLQLRPAHRAQHRPRRPGEAAADLRGVQPVQRRQLQRRQHRLLPGIRIHPRRDVDAGGDLRRTDGQLRAADHPACGEGDLLEVSGSQSQRHKDTETHRTGLGLTGWRTLDWGASSHHSPILCASSCLCVSVIDDESTARATPGRRLGPS